MRFTLPKTVKLGEEVFAFFFYHFQVDLVDTSIVNLSPQNHAATICNKQLAGPLQHDPVHLIRSCLPAVLPTESKTTLVHSMYSTLLSP